MTALIARAEQYLHDRRGAANTNAYNLIRDLLAALTGLQRENEESEEAWKEVQRQDGVELLHHIRLVEAAEVREATYHSIIQELNSVSDLERHPDLGARVDAVLLDCTNPACALDARLFAAEAEVSRLLAALPTWRGIEQTEAKEPTNG